MSNIDDVNNEPAEEILAAAQDEATPAGEPQVEEAVSQDIGDEGKEAE